VFRGGLTARIRSGHAVRVVDVSRSGALVETRSRLRPGASVDLHLEAGGVTLDTRAEVARCYVSLLRAEQILFRAALEFERELMAVCVREGTFAARG
jgi:hypothetical protein